MTVSSPVAAAPASPFPKLTSETAADAAEVEALVDRAFGPGRFVKAAERLREGREPLRGLSFVARDTGKLVGMVRQWAIRIGGAPSTAPMICVTNLVTWNGLFVCLTWNGVATLDSHLFRRILALIVQ